MASEVDNIISPVKLLDINESKEPTTNGDTTEVIGDEWGFDLDVLYKLALSFIKEKEGKAVHLTYKDKLKLIAYSKQAAHGKYRLDVSPDVGFLDVVGNDRRITDTSECQAWQVLADMPKMNAMTEYVKLLNQLCPLFRPYVDAHKAEKEEQIRKQQEEQERLKKEEENHRERQLMENDIIHRQEIEKQKQQQQELQIRNALNQQTVSQFKQYVEQQCPGNSEQQEVLIKQLQEQHYQQYMQQVYQQQLLHQQQQYQQLQAMQNSQKQQQQLGMLIPEANGPQLPNAQPLQMPTTGLPPDQHSPQKENGEKMEGYVNNSLEDEDEDTDQNDLPSIAAASMWTRKDIKEFKDSLRKDADSVIKVGSGETVTVRVPTHEDGTCLFWEFATDSYDLGFGVYFEWTIAPSNQVSVHVSESSDEEDGEEEEGAEGTTTKGDVEKGSSTKKDNRPPTDEIIPVYRRDSHEEVYCGSHQYPGRGVYLLKFDNSYSLWRSKTLYYRVYYTR